MIKKQKTFNYKNKGYKTKKTFIFFSIVATLLLLFYWYEIRPTKIKHDCSWVRKYKEAVPEKPALTEDQLREKGLLRDCTSAQSINPIREGLLQQTIVKEGFSSFCEWENGRITKQYSKIQEAIPEKEWWVKATKEEYQFCLHDNGL